MDILESPPFLWDKRKDGVRAGMCSIWRGPYPFVGSSLAKKKKTSDVFAKYTPEGLSLLTSMFAEAAAIRQSKYSI
jgi:hypothetical protein